MFLKESFSEIRFGLKDKNFESSNSELVIIHAENAKNIIERIGPLKFRYQTVNETRNRINNKILILERRLPSYHLFPI